MEIAIVVIVCLFVFLYVIGSQMQKQQARRIRGQAALRGQHLSRKDAKLAVREQARQKRAARK